MVDETNALVVVEEQPPEHIPPTYREIKPNDFIALKKDGIENIPPVQKFPYWLIAKDGLFTVRETALGRAVTRQKYFPAYLPRVGEGDGHFLWQTSIIPAEICAQIVDFFRTVFEKYGTEAEVILMMNYETNEWGVFVPPQTVSHGGVKHEFGPTDLPEKHLMVGTMHSHADFSPFHSGTDLADAEDMDGVHFTVGFVNRDEPEFVAMVMMNGIRFDYTPSDIADLSALTMAKAPEEWYEKVKVGHVVSAHKPQGFQNSVYKYTKPESFTKDNWKPTQKSYKPPYFGMGGWEDWDDNDWDEWYATTYGDRNRRRPEQSNDTIKKAQLDSEHWEDYLSDELLDSILESSVWTDGDMDDATLSPSDAQDADWWRTKFLSKLAETVNILWKLGMNVEYQARMREGFSWGNQLRKIESKKAEITVDNDMVIEGEFELLPDDTGDKSLAQKIAESPLAQKLIEEGFSVLDIVDGAVSIDVAKVKETP